MAAKKAPLRAAGKKDAAAWANAEVEYAGDREKVADIAKRLGVSQFQFIEEAKKRGWQLRGQRKRAPAQKAATAKPPKPTVLLQHVYTTIEGELKKLDSHKGASSQDRERASRALSQMVNSLEKAVEMQRAMSKTNAKGSTSKDKEQLAHAEDLRRAIAERLDRLSGKRVAGK